MPSVNITPENIRIVNNNGRVFDTDYNYLKTSNNQIPVSITSSGIPMLSMKPINMPVYPSKSYPRVPGLTDTNFYPILLVTAPAFEHRSSQYPYGPVLGPISTTYTITDIPTNIQNLSFTSRLKIDDMWKGVYYHPYFIYNSFYQKGAHIKTITNGAGQAIGTCRWGYYVTITYATISSTGNLTYKKLMIVPSPVDVVWTGNHDGTIHIPYDESGDVDTTNKVLTFIGLNVHGKEASEVAYLEVV